MKVVDIRAFQPYLSPVLPCFQDQNIPGYSEPIEGNFIMKVVDIRAFQPYLLGAYIMKVVDIGLSEIDAFSIQYARAFKPRGFFRAQ